MSVHTPGPWVIESDGYYPVVVRRFRPDHHTRICGPVHGYMYSPDEKGEQTANARLIAAAPELLEALQYVLSAHGEQLHDAFEAAHAAIAKATANG